jgi:hypothetical protein
MLFWPLISARLDFMMFDDLMRNFGDLEAVAARIGLQPDQMQALMSEIGGKIASGETDVAALATTAAEHGVSADKLQELLGTFGGPEAILGKLGGFFDKDGDGSPMNDLSGFAKGLFG